MTLIWIFSLKIGKIVLKTELYVLIYQKSTHLKGGYFMDNFVILQQMVAIDRAQNRFELRASIQTLLRIIGSCTSSERVYIFDWDETDNVFRNSYEWCGDNVQPWIDTTES